MRIGTLIALVVVLPIPCSAWGMWAWTPPQVLVDQADFVVRGTIVDVDKAAGQANIKVEETLKGAAKEKIPVKFAPARGDGIPESKDERRYGEGTSGCWILERADKDGRYDLSYPLRRMQPEQANQVKLLVENFKNIKWSKPVDGLAGAVRAIPPYVPAKDIAQYDLSVAVKNVTDKPITVEVNDVEFGFKVDGPEGIREVAKPLNIPMVVKPRDVELKSGQVIYVGWPLGSGALKREAKYSVTGTYTYQPPKDRIWLGWRGVLQTEPLELKVADK